MQEAEQKRREDRRRKKEREEELSKGKKQEAEFAVKPDDREPEKIAKKLIVFKLPSLQPKEFKEIKIREYGFNKEIPKIILSKLPFLQPKEIEETKARIKTFFTEIAEIKSIKGEIPKISVKTKPLKGVSSKILAFNIIIPSTDKKVINLTVPDLTTKYFGGFKAQKTNFNLDLPEMSVSKKQVLVPEIGMKTFSGVKAKEKNLISDILQVLSGGIPLSEVIKREKEETKEKEVALEKLKEEIGEGEGLLDILFAPIDREHDLKGVLRASSERPVIILAEKSGDDYIDALKLMLREIYRIKVGGFPKAIETKKEKEEVEMVKAETRIHVIDDDLEDIFKINKVEDSEKLDMDKLLEERIEELFSQGFGFLVFYLKKENFDFLRNSFGIREHKIPKLVLTKGKELKEDKREKISSASWGFLEPDGSWRSLSDYFSGYEKKFHNKLEKVSETKYAISVRESAEDEEGGKESNLHYLLKIFLVKYLREKLKFEGEIETETERPEKIIPDIFIPSENLAIEVETLYGTGMARLRRLGKTIEKYKGKGHKLWVVIPNLQLLLFHKDVKKIIKTFEDKIEEKELEFFGIDLNKQELVPVDELKKKVR